MEVDAGEPNDFIKTMNERVWQRNRIGNEKNVMAYTSEPKSNEGVQQRDSRELENTYQNGSLDPGQLASSVGSNLPQKPPERAGHEALLPGDGELLARSSRMTIKEFVERVFVPEHVAKKTLSGRIHYQAMLKHVIRPEDVHGMFQAGTNALKTKLRAVDGWPYLGHMLLDDTRSEDVQRVVSAAQMQGYSTQTVLHIRNTISSIFEHAIKGQRITGPNPARWASCPEMVRKETQVLTLIQTRQVLEKMQYPEKEMALIALITGMNISEICGLQWKFVNLTSDSCDGGSEPIPPRTIAVRKQWYLGELGHMNGRRSRTRDLPIPDPLLPVLLGLRTRNEFTGPDDFVLVSRHGKPINQRTIAVRRLGLIGEQLQMPWLTWHVFGRTRMNLLYEFGVKFQELIILPADKERHKSSERGSVTRALRTRMLPGPPPQLR